MRKRKILLCLYCARIMITFLHIHFCTVYSFLSEKINSRVLFSRQRLLSAWNSGAWQKQNRICTLAHPTPLALTNTHTPISTHITCTDQHPHLTNTHTSISTHIHIARALTSTHTWPTPTHTYRHIVTWHVHWPTPTHTYQHMFTSNALTNTHSH